MNLLTTALLILLFPFLAFWVNVLFGKKLPRQGDWVSVLAVFIALLLSLPIFFKAIGLYDPGWMENPRIVWFSIGSFQMTIGVLANNLMALMLTPVLLVTFLIHVYSMGYMHGDSRYSLYFGYLSLFTFSISGIVLSDNLFTLYAFWELVGVSSYLLIGFWFEKFSASQAGKKAFIVNRVGDAGMLIGLGIVYATIGSFNLNDIAAGVAAGGLSGGLLTAAGITLFMGAIGKSAQFPLHIWLPDAMEGPTPVSALIHAATMVAAGVYLTARIFFMLTPEALIVIAYIGGITAMMAAIIAIVRNDIKRVLAYSTISQLGYMVMAMGVGAYTAGFMHLITHAIFKALLFLGSGSVIHAVHTQDMREMGGLRKKMPVTYLTFLAATLAISGVPFTTGFVSKDAILAGTLGFAMEQPGHFLLPLFGFGAALLTAFYMFRLLFMTFHGEPQDHEKYDHAHESPKVMTVPLSVLGVLCFYLFFTFPSFNPFGGEGWFAHLIQKPDFAYEQTSAAATEHAAGAGLQRTEGVLHPAGETRILPAAFPGEHQPEQAGEHGEAGAAQGYAEEAHGAGHHGPEHLIAMIISLIVAATGIFLAYLMYFKKSLSAEAWAERMGPLYRLADGKFFFDELYGVTFVAAVMKGRLLLGWFDAKIIDGFVNATAPVTRGISRFSGNADLHGVDWLVNATARTVGSAGSATRQIQTGRIQNYVLATLTAVLVIILAGIL
ncbi:MAG: NADH-quinone oxidoreductase subunit L [bacterium]